MHFFARCSIYRVSRTNTVTSLIMRRYTTTTTTAAAVTTARTSTTALSRTARGDIRSSRTTTTTTSCCPSSPQLFTTPTRAYSSESSGKPVSTLVIADKNGKKLDPTNPEYCLEKFEDLPRVFKNIPLPPFVMPSLQKNKFVTPTVIQKHAIPLLLKGGDLIALAPTGTGKTLAFGLPCVAQIDYKIRKPQMLVLCPTRELVQQTAAVFDKILGDERGITIGMAYGGEPRGMQARTVGRCHVLIASPGRLNDFLNSGATSLNDIKFVVMDEADRLLDMGFAPQISEMMNHIPQGTKLQTMMFSATWDQAVQGLAEKYIGEDYFIVSTGAHASGASTNENVTQDFSFVTSPHDRERNFIDLYQKGIIKPTEKVIAFVEKKSSASIYSEAFRRRLTELYNVPYDFVDEIHGDKEQEERNRAIINFKQGNTHILIATDIVSRGIDVPNVAHVVNVEMPRTFDSYVHRIGRTGRAGAKGRAHSFIDARKDGGTSKPLIDYLQRSKQPVPDKFHAMAQNYEEIVGNKMNRRGGGGGFGRGGGRGGGRGRRDDNYNDRW